MSETKPSYDVGTMPVNERAARIAEIRGREAAATPGPWRWRGNLSVQDIELQSIPGREGNSLLSVMSFFRWGMQSAMPYFRDMQQVLRKPVWVIPIAHHEWQVEGIDHPDARFIEHSREDVAWLLSEVGTLRAAMSGLLGGVNIEQSAGSRKVIHSDRAWQEAVRAMVGRAATEGDDTDG